MASHGGDDGGRWGPSTLRVGGAGLEDGETVTRRGPAIDPSSDGAATHRNWAPGGDADGPATVRRDVPQGEARSGPAAISDGETVTMDHGAHGTLPMDDAVSTLVSGDGAAEERSQDPSWTPPPAFGGRPPPPPIQVETPSRRGVPVALVLVVALLVGAAAFAAGWFFKSEASEAIPEDQEPTGEGQGREDELVGRGEPMQEDEPRQGASAPTSTPEPSSSVAPAEAGESETSKAPPSEPPSREQLDELLSYEGYLTVRSSVDAEVYVQGKHIGPTNERLVSRCYQRFVRLKDATSGRWLTPGRPVRIACLSSTTVEIEPE